MDTLDKDTALIRVRGLKKYFPLKRQLTDFISGTPHEVLKAVDDIDLDIQTGENLGLVGESGCGKSTLARTIIRLYTPDEGSVLFDGKDITRMEKQELRKVRRDLQMIFQDPYSSLNPRMSVREMLMEALTFHKVCHKTEMEKRFYDLLSMVGIGAEAADRLPGEFSGGQRQRIGIARALAPAPRFIIADEPVSALDVSIQAQIINLLEELQERLHLTTLFISHDLRVVKHISHRVAVMYLGKIVELADTEALFEHPAHPYTDILLRAEPPLDPRLRSTEIAISGELPSPIHLPSGCRFHPRCPNARKECSEREPLLSGVGSGHFAACHYPLLSRGG